MNVSLSISKHRVRKKPSNKKNYKEYHLPPFTSLFWHYHVFAFISGYMTELRHVTVPNSSRRTGSSHPGPMNPSLKGLITSAFKSTWLSVQVCHQHETGLFPRTHEGTWSILGTAEMQKYSSYLFKLEIKYGLVSFRSKVIPLLGHRFTISFLSMLSSNMVT